MVLSLRMPNMEFVNFCVNNTMVWIDKVIFEVLKLKSIAWPYKRLHGNIKLIKKSHSPGTSRLAIIYLYVFWSKGEAEKKQPNVVCDWLKVKCRALQFTKLWPIKMQRKKRNARCWALQLHLIKGFAFLFPSHVFPMLNVALLQCKRCIHSLYIQNTKDDCGK